MKQLTKINAKVFWSVIAAVVVIAGLISISTSNKETISSKAKAITTQLRCLECEGLSVYDSDTKTSKSISKDVKIRLEQGQSKNEIINYYENVYGEYIRLEPKGKSGNWLIYVVPVFLILFLVLTIFLFVKKNISKKIQIFFFVGAGIILIIGLGLFFADSKETAKSQTKALSESSEKLLQQSVKRSPTNANYRSLAIVQFAKENYVGALQNFDKAALLDPKDAESRGYGAYIVYLSGQYELAKSRANQAVQANPTDITALFFRGLIYLQSPTKDASEEKIATDTANKDFDQVLQNAPTSEFASQIKELRSSTTTSSTTNP
ncbi:MAG: cytochrome c-type biogenesis protein CcmH [Acidimicrobiia bacterium]